MKGDNEELKPFQSFMSRSSDKEVKRSNTINADFLMLLREQLTELLLDDLMNMGTSINLPLMLFVQLSFLA